MMPATTDRNKTPVFVVGSPRSGTTLLYDMLLSAGGFAVYLTESNVFSILAQRCGDLRSRKNRTRLVDLWLASKLFRASGLDAPVIRKLVVEECGNYGDFLRITMEEIACQQGMWRWAENTPEHILYLPLIKTVLPNALVVHMIRDGRAVALSLDRRVDRGLGVLPWDRKRNLLIQGLYWEWIVRRGREYGKNFPQDYLELRFEDLIESPDQTLARLGTFIGQPLDATVIRKVAYGSVRTPNTSFNKETTGQSFDPVSRWRKSFSAEQLETFESLVGEFLGELGYPLLTQVKGPMSSKLRRTRSIYRAYYSARFALKNSALARTLRGALTAPTLDEIVMGDDHPPVLVSAKDSTKHSSVLS